MDTVEVTVADLEAIIDRLAVKHAWVDGNPVFRAVADAMDGEEDGRFGPVLLHAMRKLLELRIADPKGFDVVVLKTLCPDMTHDDLAQAMTAMDHAGWSHRARSREAVKRLVERFPQLEALLVFDKRGGDRHTRVSGAALLAEYDRMVQEERAKPRVQRRPVKRDGSICHELACRYGIRGRDGKPSWRAVEIRIIRAKNAPDHLATM